MMAREARHLRAVPTGPYDQKEQLRGEEPQRRAGYRSYRILQFAFIITPIIAGTDKYFHLLVNWDQYLSPTARHVLGSHLPLFMHVAGAVEICVGIGMIIKPSLFAYVASAWLLSIVINLLLTGAFFDIALRDFVLVLASLALGPLSQQFAKNSRDLKPKT